MISSSIATKRMPGEFFDSNVILYLADRGTSKADHAESLMRKGGNISVQVLNECANVLRLKRKSSWPETRMFLDELQALLTVSPVTVGIHESGLRLAERYGFSIYDSFIVAAALVAQCDTLWSEDMHDGLLVEQRLRIVNPFNSPRMSFVISDLRDRPDFFDAVADRIWQAWWQRHGVPLDSITTRLRENLASAGLPITLVAHRDDVFLGTASLIASDLDERPQYTPWVAAVWTEPEARGQGIAPALIARATDAGFALGFDNIYLCAAPPRRDFYLGLGWTPIEDRVGARELTVFVKHRLPHLDAHS